MWPLNLSCGTEMGSLEPTLLLFYAENVFWSSHFSPNSSSFTSPPIKWSVEPLLCCLLGGAVVTLQARLDFSFFLFFSKQQQQMTLPLFDVKVGLKLTEILRWLWPLAKPSSSVIISIKDLIFAAADCFVLFFVQKPNLSTFKVRFLKNV